MIETSAYLSLLRQIMAPFDNGIGRVVLADLPEDVQRGVLLMKSVIAGDTELQAAAMNGWGWIDSYGPLSNLYGFRDARQNGDETTLLNPLRWGTSIASAWEHMPQSRHQALMAEGWTATILEAFMAFADHASNLSRGLGRTQPLRLLRHFILCVDTNCECCRASPYVFRQIESSKQNASL